MDLCFVEAGILKTCFYWFQSRFKKIATKSFKTSSRDGKIDAFIKRIHFDRRLCGKRQSSFCEFTDSSEATKHTLVVRNVHVFLLFELSNKMVHQTIVKVFTPQMSVASSSFDLKNSIINIQNRYIE